MPMALSTLATCLNTSKPTSGHAFKMRGHTCHFICADDTHGTPIMLKAQQQGKTPEALIAEVEAEHRQDFQDFRIFDHAIPRIAQKTKL